MITNYEPFILLGIICIALLANIKLSSKVKLDIIFFCSMHIIYVVYIPLCTFSILKFLLVKWT
ncbi:106L [Yaba monkey tumor virus]|uniref:106L n=1 Tax=Yaba monkey tumor virus (strain VR587) TaxID=928314 RepID=Q6TUR3_YMTV5|nr:106L [Yaba monkey tumor virus]AAR07462.1 106L [Yaba monkey tumor virus]